MKKKKTLKKIPATAPPFVQIAAEGTDARGVLYGLDANGRVWEWDDGDGGWMLMPTNVIVDE